MSLIGPWHHSLPATESRDRLSVHDQSNPLGFFFFLLLVSLLSLLKRGLTSPPLAEGFNFHGPTWNLALDMLQLDLSVL